jgi:hypothetical protein
VATYTIYSTVTGEILKCTGKPDAEGPPVLLKPNQGYLIGQYSPSKYKIVDGEPTLKESSHAVIDRKHISASTEYAKITGIPERTSVQVQGNDETFLYQVDDGEFEFSIDTPGPYEIALTLTPGATHSEKFQIEVS